MCYKGISRRRIRCKWEGGEARAGNSSGWEGATLRTTYTQPLPTSEPQSLLPKISSISPPNSEDSARVSLTFLSSVLRESHCFRHSDLEFYSLRPLLLSSTHRPFIAKDWIWTHKDSCLHSSILVPRLYYQSSLPLLWLIAVSAFHLTQHAGETFQSSRVPNEKLSMTLRSLEDQWQSFAYPFVFIFCLPPSCSLGAKLRSCSLPSVSTFWCKLSWMQSISLCCLPAQTDSPPSQGQAHYHLLP